LSDTILFKKLVVENFRTFIGEHTLSLGTPGLHYVYGVNEDEPDLESNGAGKSTLFDALCWCLYGKLLSGLRSPDIKPRHQGKCQTRVAVTISTNGKVLVIERSLNPNRLTINGNDCDQKAIDRKMMPLELFGSSVLIGQGQPLFFDLKPADKMALFSDALNLGKWETWARAAADKVAELTERQRSLDLKADHLYAIQQKLKVDIQEAQRKYDRWNDEEAARCTKFMQELEDRHKTLKVQSNLKDKADLACDGAGTELKALQTRIRAIEAEGKELYLVEARMTAEIEARGREVRALTKEFDSMGDVCPTCGQKITGTDREKHKKAVQKKLREAQAIMEEWQGKRKKQQLLIGRQQEKVDSEKDYAKQFEKKADDARSALDRLIPVVANLTSRIRVLEQAIKDSENTLNPYGDLLNDLQKQKTRTKAELREAEEKLRKVETKIKQNKYWVKGFKDIRLYIIDEVRDELRMVTNAMLEQVGLPGWRINYEIERETKSGTIKPGLNIFIQGKRDKEPVKWECWSKGEGQRLRLVGAMALSEVLLNHAGFSTNLEVYDEPTRSMTNHGINDLIELLATRAEIGGRSIFFIDHKAMESSNFTSAIQVVKDSEGCSTIS
jgi:DNA repair exonuclease SbcCD ATPase subunit